VIVGAPDIDAFVKEGKMMPASRVDIASSGVGIAVKAGSPRPDISSGEAVKKALLSATAVAYSTGASGVYVQRLFDRLGIADQMKDKSKQTSPGVRVAQYLASGEADLGFQQVSELVHETGIDFLGPLPADIQKGRPASPSEPTAIGELLPSFAGIEKRNCEDFADGACRPFDAGPSESIAGNHLVGLSTKSQKRC